MRVISVRISLLVCCVVPRMKCLGESAGNSGCRTRVLIMLRVKRWIVSARGHSKKVCSSVSWFGVTQDKHVGFAFPVHFRQLNGREFVRILYVVSLILGSMYDLWRILKSKGMLGLIVGQGELQDVRM